MLTDFKIRPQQRGVLLHIGQEKRYTSLMTTTGTIMEGQ